MPDKTESDKNNRRNILVQSISFLLIFSGYRTNQDIAQRVLKSYEHETTNTTEPFEGIDGYKTSSLIFAVFAVFTWVAPVIVGLLGPKKSMLLGGSTFTGILASYIWPRPVFLQLFSVLNGAGSAVLWTAQGAFMVANSSEKNIVKNSAVFWTIFQMSYFFGNIYIYFAWNGVETIGSEQRVPLYTIFTGLAFAGCFALLFTQENDEKYHVTDTDSEQSVKTRKLDSSETISPLNLVIASMKKSFNILKSPIMLQACLTFAYSGIQFCFQAMIHSTCIASTPTFGTDSDKIMGMNGIVTGLGQVSAGFILTRQNLLKSHQIFITGMFSTIIAVGLIFLNYGNDCSNGLNYLGDTAPGFIGPDSMIMMSLIPGFLLGFSYSALNTQIYAFMKRYYPETPVPAFAIFKCVQACSAAIGFRWFSKLDIGVQCGCMFVFAVGNCSTFYKLLRNWEIAQN